MPELVITARERDLGDLIVGRVLPFAQRRMVGPFIFLDHIGPTDVPAGAPRSMDVRPHPHIGLSTLTYLFAGEISHRDSLGYEQLIHPGEVNWMTAGRAITHSERFEGLRRRGGALHGVQAWVALPDAHEECSPAFEHHAREALPSRARDGVTTRLIAGSAFGATSPVTTHSPLFYVHAELERDAELELPNEHSERAAYIVAGELEHDAQVYGEKQLLVFAARAEARLKARRATTLMLLGGEPVGTRHIWWNFVASRPELIERAKSEWKAQRLPLPPTDHDEYTPLPDDPPPPAPPMS